MNKNKYEMPEVEVQILSQDDVIVTSNPDEPIELPPLSDSIAW